jgi:hypothetical protein
LSKVAPSPVAEPVVRIRLDNGRIAVMTSDQVVFRTGAVPVPVGALNAGDVLEASFHYPPGYRLRGSDAEPGPPRAPGVVVVAVEPAGSEIVYSGRVKETGCLFLSAGILCAL